MKTRPTEIYSDEAILVIDKPAGWLSIPDRFDFQRPNIRHYYQQRLGEIFIVHRLDAETSGVMVLAKTAAALTREGSLVSVAGGGDTVAALNHAGVADEFTYVSTAGGAFLEWLEGKTLPGVAALSD